MRLLDWLERHLRMPWDLPISEAVEVTRAAVGKPTSRVTPSVAGVTHTAPTLGAVRQAPSRGAPPATASNDKRPRALPRGRR